jgi:hypothetical protein
MAPQTACGCMRTGQPRRLACAAAASIAPRPVEAPGGPATPAVPAAVGHACRRRGADLRTGGERQDRARAPLAGGGRPGRSGGVGADRARGARQPALLAVRDRRAGRRRPRRRADGSRRPCPRWPRSSTCSPDPRRRRRPRPSASPSARPSSGSSDTSPATSRRPRSRPSCASLRTPSARTCATSTPSSMPTAAPRRSAAPGGSDCSRPRSRLD